MDKGTRTKNKERYKCFTILDHPVCSLNTSLPIDLIILVSLGLSLIIDLIIFDHATDHILARWSSQVWIELIFIGPESDHWQCLSLTESLTDSLPFIKLDWCLGLGRGPFFEISYLPANTKQIQGGPSFKNHPVSDIFTFFLVTCVWQLLRCLKTGPFNGHCIFVTETSAQYFSQLSTAKNLNRCNPPSL